MKCGYIRVASSGPTVATQRQMLRAVPGLDGDATDPVYVDTGWPQRVRGTVVLPERARLIDALGTDGRGAVVVAVEGVIGVDTEDTLDVLLTLAARRITLVIAATGQEFRWSPAVVAGLNAVRSAAIQRRLWRLQHAREAITPESHPMALDDKQREQAALAWHDMTRRGQDVAAEFGVSTRTLYNIFGARRTRSRRRADK